MNKSDFLVGQKVYLKTIKGNYCWEREHIIPAVVTKIGRKYITVAVGENGDGFEYQFDHTDRFRQCTKYSPDYALYLTEQAIYDYWQAAYLHSAITHHFLRCGHKYDLRTLKTIAQCIHVPLTYNGGKTEDA